MKRKKNILSPMQLNIIPLIDVMLVLLAIFMVTAPTVKLTQVHVPLASLGSSINKKVFLINVEPQKISVNDGKKITVIASHQIKNYFELIPHSQVISIAADKSVPYGRVVDIFSNISQLGFSDVRLVVKKKLG